MSHINPPAGIRIASVFHPSDFTEASEVAFAHALKIALISKAHFCILHVSADPNADWQDFPGIRDALQRWGLLPPGSSHRVINELGINVEKVMATNKDPVKACLHYLETHSADLIVLAVHQHEG